MLYILFVFLFHLFPQEKELAFKLYVVKKGDTFFKIAKNFYGDGEKWKDIWQYNKYIKKPHWIFPGDEIVIPYYREKVVKKEEVKEEKKEVKETKKHLQKQELKDPDALVVDYYPEDEENPIDFDYDGKIIDFVANKQIHGTGDKCILNLGRINKIKKDDYYSVYRIMRDVIDPDTGETLGVLIKRIGRLKITPDIKENSSIAVIVSSMFPLEVGDFVRKIRE